MTLYLQNTEWAKDERDLIELRRSRKPNKAIIWLGMVFANTFETICFDFVFLLLTSWLRKENKRYTRVYHKMTWEAGRDKSLTAAC